MAVRSDIYVRWDLYPRIIYIETPSVIITLQDLVDTCRELEEELDNLDKPKLIDADGKQYLFTTDEGDNFVGITVTLQGTQLAFEARGGPSWILCSILGGNLVAVDTTLNPGDPGYYIDARYPTAYVSIDRTLSASPTITDLALSNTLVEILGLVQNNFVMDQQVYQDYNGAKLLTSARIRTYEEAAKTTLIATYAVTAAWSNGECTSYECLKQ